MKAAGEVCRELPSDNHKKTCLPSPTCRALNVDDMLDPGLSGSTAAPPRRQDGADGESEELLQYDPEELHAAIGMPGPSRSQ